MTRFGIGVVVVLAFVAGLLIGQLLIDRVLQLIP